MEIIPLGDSALIIRVRENFANDPEGALSAVRELQRRLRSATIPGVTEYAPAYDSLGVFFDLTASVESFLSDDVFGRLKMRIAAAAAQPLREKAILSEAPLVEIPVCYEPEFALDLEEVARHAALSPMEVVRRHSAADYRVHCVGFTPGFPYLGGLPAELAMPRHATPRKKVPAGSVAIGGVQAGVYPVASPGGWSVIGRTPLRLFNAEREPSALLAAGMRVRFRAITRAKFDAFRS